MLEEDDTDSKHAAIQQATLDRPLDNVGLRLLLSPAGVPQSLLLPPLQGTTFSNALDLPDWTVPVEQQLPVYVSLLELLFSLLSSLVVQEEKLYCSTKTVRKSFTEGIYSIPQDLECGVLARNGHTHCVCDGTNSQDTEHYSVLHLCFLVINVFVSVLCLRCGESIPGLYTAWDWPGQISKKGKHDI